MPGHIPFPSFCAVGTDNYFSFIFICRLNKNFTSTVQINAGITTTTHYSLLDIYISQKKTWLCVVNLEEQFQTCVEAKLINFFYLKIQIFFLFLAGVVKSSAFCTLLLIFQRVEVLKLQFDEKT